MSSLTHEILHWRTKNKKSLSLFQHHLLLTKYKDFTKHAFRKYFNGKKAIRKPPVPGFFPLGRLLPKCYSCAKIQFCLWWFKDDTVLSLKLVLPWVRTFWHQTRLKRTDGCRNMIKKKKRKKKQISKHCCIFPWIFPERNRKEFLKRLDHLIPVRFNPKINISNTWIIKKSQMLNTNLDAAKWSL